MGKTRARHRKLSERFLDSNWERGSRRELAVAWLTAGFDEEDVMKIGWPCGNRW